MIRAFLAVKLFPDEHQAVTKICNDIRQHPCASTVRWVHGTGFHLTLAFLGEIDQDQPAVVSETISDMILSFDGIPLKFSQKLKVFPSWNRMRIIAMGIDDISDKLHLLQDQIVSALKYRGFKLDNKKFQPHLTLGRVRKGTPQDQIIELAEFLKLQSLEESSSWIVNNIYLVQSQLGSGRPRYSSLDRYPLRAA